jgi:hypothetical protein
MFHAQKQQTIVLPVYTIAYACWCTLQLSRRNRGGILPRPKWWGNRIMTRLFLQIPHLTHANCSADLELHVFLTHNHHAELGWRRRIRAVGEYPEGRLLRPTQNTIFLGSAYACVVRFCFPGRLHVERLHVIQSSVFLEYMAYVLLRYIRCFLR